MFISARIKLTAWYLLIIMCISMSFSLVIYRMLTFEMDRFAERQQTRIENQLKDKTLFPEPQRPAGQPKFIAVDPELVHETKQRLLIQMLLLNATILVISGGLGYILAGKTLKPIANMLSEQRRFVSDASHELRTPLTALKSSMEVAVRDPNLTATVAKGVLKENIEEVNNLQTLTDQLLELARLEMNGNKKQYHVVDGAAILLQAIKRITPLAKKKGITIEEHLDHCFVLGNEYGLSDVAIMLLDNAIKYSPKNATIVVTTAAQNAHAIITIQDHGIGIDSKDLPHIFDRFYRADSARVKSKTNGYGLGLAIAKKIIEEHHGKLLVKSTLHKGSVFTAMIPLYTET